MIGASIFICPKRCSSRPVPTVFVGADVRDRPPPSCAHVFKRGELMRPKKLHAFEEAGYRSGNRRILKKIKRIKGERIFKTKATKG
jgi:hypothetical protein